MRPGKTLFALVVLGSLAGCYPPTQPLCCGPGGSYASAGAPVTYGGPGTTYGGHGTSSTVIPTSWGPEFAR